MLRNQGRVLLVDADRRTRVPSATALKQEGYIVDEAHNAQTAVDMLLACRPNVVVLDLMAPGVRNDLFLHRLQTDFSSIPIVAISGVLGVHLGRVHPLCVGDILEKPASTERLLNQVALGALRSFGIPTCDELDVPRKYCAVRKQSGVILLIDDDRNTVTTLDQAFSLLGYTVVSISGIIAEIPRLACALEPQAIFLELLTDFDGLIALQMLRAIPGLAHVPITVYSAHQSDLDQHREEIHALHARTQQLIISSLVESISPMEHTPNEKELVGVV